MIHFLWAKGRGTRVPELDEGGVDDLEGGGHDRADGAAQREGLKVEAAWGVGVGPVSCPMGVGPEVASVRLSCW